MSTNKKHRKNYFFHLILVVLFLASIFIAFFVTKYFREKAFAQSNASSVNPVLHATVMYKKCNNAQNYPALTKGHNKLACFAEEMQKVAYDFGQEYSLKVLFALQEKDPEAKNCHFIAHGIGWGVYKKNPGDWQNLIAGSSGQCSYGEQMGIIEQYTQTLKEGQLTKKDVPNLCGPHPRADCNHAVGHMMLVQTRDDLPKAIDLCDGLTESDQRFICYHGMVMEHMIGGNLIEHGIRPESMSNWAQRLPDDIKFCGTLSGMLQTACWREIVHPAYFYFNKQAKPILDLCEQAPSEDAKKFCKIHMIPEIAGGSSYDLSYLKNMCEAEAGRDPGFTHECLLQNPAIKLSFVALRDAQDVVPYCSALDPSLRAECFNRIGNSIQQMPVEQTKAYCEKAPEKFQALCRGDKFLKNELAPKFTGD